MRSWMLEAGRLHGPTRGARTLPISCIRSRPWWSHSAWVPCNPPAPLRRSLREPPQPWWTTTRSQQWSHDRRPDGSDDCVMTSRSGRLPLSAQDPVGDRLEGGQGFVGVCEVERDLVPAGAELDCLLVGRVALEPVAGVRVESEVPCVEIGLEER